MPNRTICLPDDLDARVRRLAADKSIGTDSASQTVASVIRKALRIGVESLERQKAHKSAKRTA